MKRGLLIAATPALLTQLLLCQSGAAGTSDMDMDRENACTHHCEAPEKGGDFADVYLENRIRAK